MKLNALVLAVLAVSSTAMADMSVNDVPVGCKNLALMAAQLLQTRADSGSFSEQPSNPTKLTLKANNGFEITKVQDLGGDSDESGKLPCSKGAAICTNPAGAGGAIDWAKLTIEPKGADYAAAEVIVSMGSRGGCTLSSAKVPALK